MTTDSTVKVPWPTSKCILCRSKYGITEEHLIPKSLGGRLVVRFLCKKCNSKLGHGPESKVRDDPIVRTLIERLACARPDIADDIRNGFGYVRCNEQGVVTRHVLKDGSLRVLEECQDGGTLILQNSNVLGAVAKMAEKMVTNCPYQQISIWTACPLATRLRLLLKFR